MILTGKIIRIEGGEIVFEFPDFPEQQKAALPDDGMIGYRPKRAAELLGISRGTLWRETKLGRIHKTSLGRYWHKELERYMEAETKAAKRKAK